MRSIYGIFLILFIAVSCQKATISPQKPGVYDDFTLLPNGWRLTPVGKQAQIGELPLNMIVTPDERFAVTSNSGAGEHSLSLISLKDFKEVQRVKLPKTWRGLAFNGDGSKLFVSGGNDECIRVFDWQGDTLAYRDSIGLRTEDSKEKVSVTGLAYWREKDEVFAVSKESNKLYRISLRQKPAIDFLSLSGKCYDVIVNPKKPEVYVSVWGKGFVAFIDPENFKITDSVKVGPHPSEMTVTKDGKTLFVANANSNTVSVVDVRKRRVIETLNTALKPDMPAGSTPNSVALSADEKTLFIANADNNYLAVFDVSQPGKSHSLGFIPVGWYPTVVRTLAKSGKILVANGKGLASSANPLGPKPGVRQSKNKGIDQYIGRMFKGVISLIPVPDKKLLAKWSAKVYENTPFTREKVKLSLNQHVVSAEHSGERSKVVKYVFYIIRENRTYDQILGDLPEGEGDSSLCLFPASVTPNAHKLAQEFVLFDNFYVDAEVSADGHNWSTAAYATDYVEKTWPTFYGGRGGSYDYEGGAPIASPSSGYIWDNVINHGLPFRTYGEFTKKDPRRPGKYTSSLPSLQPYVCPTFPGWNLKIPDTLRVARWKEDFDSLVSVNAVPALSVIRLPNDHTAGTRLGFPTVRAMIAENDYALGLFVEHLSQSPVWEKSVVFVVEDDAQNGSDHIDAHRSPLLIIGPHVKRNFVDHTMYSTSGVLKTIELILGLPPMTQFDLSATPLLNAFTDKADATPYKAERPQNDMGEPNTPGLYGVRRSGEFNFEKEDAIPDIEFNEIIWKAVRGADSEMPAPVRSAFVKIEKD
ncbi:MAG: beta-propeller fold lactonase family protein [Calditrichaeota bacterium]|nr:beta-propeller fold lactonase family protein [Calditrichota bacterium]